MWNKFKGCLWLQLSLLLGLVSAGVLAAFAMALEEHVSARDAFLECLVAAFISTALVLHTGFASLHDLADAASAMSEGDPLTVQSVSLNDVGRITRALRTLQTSAQMAMSRLPGGNVSSTASWPVIAIGNKANGSRLRHALITSFVVAWFGIYTGPAVYFFFIHKPPAALTMHQPVAEQHPRPTSPAMPSVRGVTKDSITVGMSAPFSGGPRSLSDGMKLGLDTAFAEVNAAGGVHGRQLKLVALDNGYEEARALETTRDLVENRHVFGMIGNVGTPTVKAVLSYLSTNKVLLFGPLTGSPVTRSDPPDRYVFNVRASYERETSTMINYLVDVRHVLAKQIVVFAQNDSFGDAGYDGASKTLRKKGHTGDLFRVGYDRNTADVTDAVARVVVYNTANVKAGGVRAVIVVATATASASFTAKLMAAGVDAVVMNVSFVDAGALAQEFRDHWPGVGGGVIVTQVVPHFESGATGVIRYRDALKAFFPDRAPGFASLEGYVVGALFAEGLRLAGPDVDTERVVTALEKIQDLDLGTGGSYSFGPSKHWASQKVWGTVLTSNGTFKPLDSEWSE